MREDIDRRDVLKAGLGLAAMTAFPLGGAGAAEPAPRTGAAKMMLGLVTFNLAKDWDLETIIKQCQETGFEAVELRTTHAHKVEPNLTPTQRAEVRQKFADSKVILYSLGTVCEFHSPDPAEVRKNIETCGQFIQLAKDVGAQAVKVRPNALPKEVEPAKTMEQIGKALAECGTMGANAGIKIVMEVHGKGTSLPPNARTILDHANLPNVYACWNSNNTDVKDGSIKEYFELLKDRLLTVHMRDLYLKEYPWRELLGLLNQANFTGPTLAEIPESTDPMRVMRYFRALWEEMQRA